MNTLWLLLPHRGYVSAPAGDEDVRGVAMKSEPVTVGGRKTHAPGMMIGKALEPLAGGVGEILVLPSPQ